MSLESKYWNQRTETWVCPRDSTDMDFKSKRTKADDYNYHCKTCGFTYSNFSRKRFSDEAKNYHKRLASSQKHLHSKRQKPRSNRLEKLTR